MTYLLRKSAQLLLILFGVSFVAFFVVHLTGDPAIVILGEQTTSQALADYRQEHGLDNPLIVQYARFLSAAIRGDFGNSLRYRVPVFQLYMERLPATLELAAAALSVSMVVGISVGTIAALRQGSLWDMLVRGGALLGQAVPGFYLGLMSIIVFGATLKWLPTGGRGTLAHLVLPTMTLVAYQAAIVARFVRGSMLEVLEEDYIRTARAKGLTSARVGVGHALRNAFIPVATLMGLQAGSLLSGTVVTETVFSWPGVGRLAVQALYSRDFPVVQMTLLVTSALFVVINLGMDLLYVLIDPRIRYE